MSDAPGLDPETLADLREGLWCIALRSLGDPDAAEEVVQETLARGLEALRDGRLEDPGKLASYFRSICQHVVVDTIRARSRTTSLDAMPERSDGKPAGDALRALITEEEKARVVRALARLPAESRECLRLSFYEGLKPAEVAERLGEPGPRIRKRRSRALQRLREVFFEEAGGAGGHETGGNPTVEQGGRSSGTEDRGEDR